MAQQRDEVGRSGIYPAGVPVPADAKVITPGDINEGRTDPHRRAPAVGPSDDAKKAERLPRKGDDINDIGEIPTD